MNELSLYHSGLLSGECGGLEIKHHELARILKATQLQRTGRSHLISWETISNYMRDKIKYDDWTLRDIDKVYSILNQ